MLVHAIYQMPFFPADSHSAIVMPQILGKGALATLAKEAAALAAPGVALRRAGRPRGREAAALAASLAPLLEAAVGPGVAVRRDVERAARARRVRRAR